MYIVLGMLYESYVHPITILSTIPSAGVGALLALMIFGIELNVMALIGILLLGVGLFIRLHVLESPIFAAAQEKAEKTTEIPILHARDKDDGSKLPSAWTLGLEAQFTAGFAALALAKLRAPVWMAVL